MRNWLAKMQWNLDTWNEQGYDVSDYEEKVAICEHFAWIAQQLD